MFGSNRNDWMRPLLRNEFRNELQNFFQTNSFGPQTGTTRRTSGVFPAINMYDDGESFLVRTEADTSGGASGSASRSTRRRFRPISTTACSS